MKILLAASVSPLTAREELHWAQAILKRLSDKGYQVDLFTLPIVQNQLLLPEQFMALRLLTIDPVCDLLITIGYPAFALKHPRKRALLFSLASSLHEWFDSEYGILATPEYHSIRHSIKAAEKNCLAEAEHIVCASASLAKILRNEYKLNPNSHILSDIYEDENETRLPAQERWIAAESTLEPCDRVDLLLDVIVLSSGKWKLALFVPAASPVYYNALLQRVEKLRIQDRIDIINAPLSIAALENSLFHIVFRYQSTRIPECIIRAVKSNVPVIALSDGGGLLEVVRNNVNGLVLNPNAKSIARSLDQVCTNASPVETLSKGSRNFVNKFASIDKVVEELIG